MRYIALALFAIFIPILSNLLSSNVMVRRWTWFAIGMAPYVYGWAHLSASIISWSMWPGYVKGALVALPDILAMAILLSSRGKGRFSPEFALFVIYILLSSVSIAYSEVRTASAFYTWQLLRMLLVAFAVARVCRNPQATRMIIYGLCCGIAFQACSSLYERVFHGVLQASGTMAHQNLLGMMTYLPLFSSFTLILSGDRSIISKIGLAASLVTVVLTGSRGTVGIAGVAFFALLILSILSDPSRRKMMVAAVSAGVILIVAPVAYGTLHKRFISEPRSTGYDERAAFEKAAHLMIQDHPMGVGANEYVLVANARGYSNRAGVIAVSGSRAANVHNVYLLMAAETGILGLASFSVLLLYCIGAAFALAWAKPRFQCSQIAAAIGITLIAIAVHSFVEWIFVTEGMQYLFAMCIGFIAGLRRQRLDELVAAKARRRSVHDTGSESLPLAVGAKGISLSSLLR